MGSFYLSVRLFLLVLDSKKDSKFELFCNFSQSMLLFNSSFFWFLKFLDYKLLTNPNRKLFFSVVGLHRYKGLSMYNFSPLSRNIWSLWSMKEETIPSVNASHAGLDRRAGLCWHVPNQTRHRSPANHLDINWCFETHLVINMPGSNRSDSTASQDWNIPFVVTGQPVFHQECPCALTGQSRHVSVLVPRQD